MVLLPTSIYKRYMKKLLFLIIFSISTLAANAGDVIYEKSDSVYIEEVIAQIKNESFDTKGEMILAIAKHFIGAEYAGGTLERGCEEPLFISCTKVDCTTFVELVLSIALTIEKNGSSFTEVCNSLERVRYRGGVRNGYESRLHYISWWIDDNARLGILEDVTACPYSQKQRLNINFMSTHPQSYALLKENPRLRRSIEELEVPYRGIEVDYIPKQELQRGEDEIGILNGDIVALATNIEGLDVSHIGFAFWKNGRLHLLHASSKEEKVIMDPVTLYDYQKNKRTHIGIRVFRLQ